MIWLVVVLVVLAMGGIALVAAGGGQPMVEEYDDRPDVLVPADRTLEPADLRRARFTLAFRGYRMAEVDALLDRLARELEAERGWQPLDEPAPAADPQPQPGPADDTSDGPLPPG